MTIKGIIDELESLLLDASHVPFTNKRILEEDDMIRLLDDLREKLPNALTEANQIVADQQRILEDAQKEANKIIEQAKGYAIKLTDENTIAKQAEEHGSEIINLANQEAAKLQQDAVGYANDVFAHLEGQLEKALEVVRYGHSELNQPKRKKVE